MQGPVPTASYCSMYCTTTYSKLLRVDFIEKRMDPLVHIYAQYFCQILIFGQIQAHLQGQIVPLTIE